MEISLVALYVYELKFIFKFYAPVFDRIKTNQVYDLVYMLFHVIECSFPICVRQAVGTTETK